MKNLLLALSFLFTITAKAQDDILQKGQQIPNFTILSANGNGIDSSLLKHKVVLINFFATWCGPCLMELPFLQTKIWEKYKNNKDFCLLVIGRDHSQEEINAFKKKHHFDLPMYPDKNKLIYSLFATKYIPRNYLIDKDGTLVYESMGYEEKEFSELVKKVDELLK